MALNSSYVKALKLLIPKFEELGIDYVVIGGFALNYYGYNNNTDDIDILVSKSGSAKILNNRNFLGLKDSFDGSFVVLGTGVDLDIIVEGEQDLSEGKYPNPNTLDSVLFNGIKILGLYELINVKLKVGRHKDFTAVIELIKQLNLDESIFSKLDPSVELTFLELLRIARKELYSMGDKKNPNYLRKRRFI